MGVWCGVAHGLDEVELRESFAAFKVEHSRQYDGVEHEKRFDIFKSNMGLAKIAQENNPNATFGVTQFSDLTPEEFQVRLGLRYPEGWQHTNPANIYTQAEIDASASSADWVAKGALPPPKDQGHCGSCWAFSTVANIEAQHFIATGTLMTLSEQELTSCDTKDGGCQGGLMDQAFTWITQDRAGEMVTEAWYPYVSGDGTTRGCGGQDGKYTLCKGKGGAATDGWCTQFCYNAQGAALCTADLCDCSPTGEHVGATISGFTDLPKDEDQLAAWLADNGPISVGVAVPLGTVWQSYTGGILSASDCPASSPNHGVLLAGFDKGAGYWKIRNSWGEKFGESGYIRVAYGTNTCNLVFSPSSSKVSHSTVV